MKRLIILAVMVASPAIAAKPYARLTIDGADQIVPGQEVHVIVEVLAPDFFTLPPQFPLFDVPGAMVTLPAERTQNMVQTIDGQQYAGIRRTYAVVPEQPGSFSIPSIAISLGWSVEGKPTTGEVVTEPVSFDVVEGTGSAFAAKRVEITQSFDRDPSKLKAGDALVRTIVVSAQETQGITIPAADIGTTPGLRQYVKPSKVEDAVPFGRGDTVSRRTEAIVYTTDKEGSFTIPAVSYSWFDTDSHQDQSSPLPSIRVLVAAAAPEAGIAIDDLPTGTDDTRARRETMTGILLALVAAIIVWFGRRAPSRAVSCWHAFTERRRHSRRYRLRRLRKTIMKAAPTDVYAALHVWARAEGYRTLHDWLAGLRPEVVLQVGTIERGLFSDGKPDFDRKKLASMLDDRLHAAPATKSALPPLNPGQAADVTLM